MFSKKFLGVLIGCIVLIIATDVSAWDRQRKGFVLGFGLGPGLTSYTTERDGTISDRETKFGLQTDFKIGYAPTDLLQVCYTNKVSWFSVEFYKSGLSAVGVSYYLLPEAPSVFFSGGIGISYWNALFEYEGTEVGTGYGLYGGAGYEFTRYWNTEFDLVWGKPIIWGEVSEGDRSINALSFMLTINVLGY